QSPEYIQLPGSLRADSVFIIVTWQPEDIRGGAERTIERLPVGRHVARTVDTRKHSRIGAEGRSTRLFDPGAGLCQIQIAGDRLVDECHKDRIVESLPPIGVGAARIDRPGA